MSKKKRKVAKTGPVWHLSKTEATLASKPRYDAYACGYGAHGDTRYSRKKSKDELRRILKDEGASRGSFPLAC